MWFLGEGSARLQHERRRVAELAESVLWLQSIRWRIDAEAVCICLDASIVQDDTLEFPVTVRYPVLFPHTPPSVVPQHNIERCWSQHQYVARDGRPGELCLEYGPDNWTTDLTGADLLASAYRLLVGDVDDRDEPRPEVPSRHQTTLGQDLRSVTFRFVVTRELLSFAQSLPSGSLVPATFQSSSLPMSFTAVLRTATVADGPAWIDSAVPDNISVGQKGVICRVGEAASTVVGATSYSDLCHTLSGAGIALDSWCKAQAELPSYIVLAADDQIAVRWMSPSLRDRLVPFDTILVEVDGYTCTASPYRNLTKRKVAIVGCGSAGSKVAVSMARSGVGHFVLVDDDIVLPGNLVRNDLDWRDVGGHKVDALSARISLVNPSARRYIRRIRLSAQESASVAAAVLSELASCDLIVDATADASVFNILSSVVVSASKPLLWLEVFGGGFGGLIARCRPGTGSNPQSMRSGILHFCSQQGNDWPRSMGSYEAEAPYEAPLVADDAAVSVIAANATRMALDQLDSQEPSRFPHDVYLIGLSEDWCFAEPFDIRPIDVRPEIGSIDPVPDPAEMRAGWEFVKSLLDQQSSESVDPR